MGVGDKASSLARKWLDKQNMLTLGLADPAYSRNSHLVFSLLLLVLLSMWVYLTTNCACGIGEYIKCKEFLLIIGVSLRHGQSHIFGWFNFKSSILSLNMKIKNKKFRLKSLYYAWNVSSQCCALVPCLWIIKYRSLQFI